MRTKLQFALGLARKAGAVVFGTQLVQDAVRHGRVQCVLLSSDASENTKKKISNTCAHYRVPLYPVSLTMLDVAGAIGSQRLSSAVALTPHGVVRLVLDALQDGPAQEA